MTRFFTISYLILALRYFVIAGIAFVIFYAIKPARLMRLRIQNTFPKRKDYYREIGYSMLSFFFFAVYVVILFKSPVRQYTRIYDHPSELGWPYFFFSIFLCVVIHDTYFYWTHRLMHHPKLFKAFHVLHHKSTNPSPWAAFSFQPLESIVEGGIAPVIVFLIPIQRYAFLSFFIFSTIINVYGHLGYEIYPKWLIKSRLGKYINTSVAHNMHHKYFNGNYSFYTRIWDILMGTMHPDYETSLDKVLTKEPNAA
jgi:lathosterol oxidase